MNRARHYAAACLLAGLLLAVGTPVYVSWAEPGLAVYLWHPPLFLMQAVPYLVCAAIWLPLRSPVAVRIAFGLSLVMLLAACALYGPMLVKPRILGGDMVALLFAFISLVTLVAMLGISMVAFAAAWRSLRGRQRGTQPSRTAPPVVPNGG